MTPAPKRRWFRFSLRTLLVAVTVISVWLGYYVNWKNQRREARMWLSMQMNGGSFGGFDGKPAEFPWTLKLLGEKPERLILVRYEPADAYLDLYPIPDEYQALVRHVERLFPEADVLDLTRTRSDDEDGSE
jgi:hypothetical protein